MPETLQTTAYFGIPGSFTHGAAMAYFGESTAYEGGASFKDVFSMVKNNQCDYGIVPIENTLAGSIYQNYDLLQQYQLHVTGEISRKVEQTLLVSKFAVGVSVEDLTAVYSHPKALEQCSIFLDKHPQIVRHAYHDTATAAKFVSEQDDRTIAAIANTEAGKMYDLSELQTNIEDNGYNYTRFLIISRDKLDTAEADKCSMVINLAHVSGSLSKAMSFLTDAGCSLTKIESRPLENKPFEYTFYLDFVFDPAIQDMPRLLKDLEGKVQYLRILGLYQKENTQFGQA